MYNKITFFSYFTLKILEILEYVVSKTDAAAIMFGVTNKID